METIALFPFDRTPVAITYAKEEESAAQIRYRVARYADGVDLVRLELRLNHAGLVGLSSLMNKLLQDVTRHENSAIYKWAKMRTLPGNSTWG